MGDIKWANGLNFFDTDKAPDYVLAKMSFDVERFIETLNEHVDAEGRVNVVVMRSKNTGNPYAKIDDWRPNRQEQQNDRQEQAPMRPRPAPAKPAPAPFEVDDGDSEQIPF